MMFIHNKPQKSRFKGSNYFLMGKIKSYKRKISKIEMQWEKIKVTHKTIIII